MIARDILKDLVAINTIADKCSQEFMDTPSWASAWRE